MSRMWVVGLEPSPCQKLIPRISSFSLERSVSVDKALVARALAVTTSSPWNFDRYVRKGVRTPPKM